MLHKIESKEDLVLILKEAIKIHDQSHWKPWVLDLERTCKYLENAERVPDKFFFIYDKNKEGEITGLFLGVIISHPLIQVKKANDLTFYVDPRYRGTTLFIRMVRQFERWAKINGAMISELMYNTGIPNDHTPELFKALGYNHAGYIFNKEL